MTFEEAKKSIRWILTVSHPIGSWELENIMDALDITPCDISTCKVAKALWGNKGNIPDIDISRVKNGTPLEAQPTDEIKEAYLKGYDYGVKDWFKSKTQPCEDAVSREALETINYKVGDMPAVYPERPKGKWNFIGDQMFECSSCKRTYTQNQFEELRIYTTDDLLPKFCPNCGAEMIGGE